MRLRVPCGRIRAEFHLTYEMQGCQRAVDYLCKYYRVRRMRIVLDGKRTGKTCVAFYENNKAVFRKSSLNKQNVTHEFFHHLVNCKRLSMAEREEEKEANAFAREFLKGWS